MTPDTVTMAQLEQFLLRMGFVSVPTRGPHRLYEHTPTQTEVLLPAGHPDELAGRARLLGIRTTVIERGVVADTVYDALFAEVTGSGPRTSTGTAGSLNVSRS